MAICLRSAAPETGAVRKRQSGLKSRSFPALTSPAIGAMLVAGVRIMKRDLKLPRRKRRIALWIAGILLSYGILGAVLLPPLIKHIAVKQISKQLGRDVSIQAIHIHPFDCSVTIRDLLIKEPDGAPFVSWETVHVNFQITSLFGKAYTFKTISTTKPTVHVRVNADGTFN